MAAYPANLFNLSTPECSLGEKVDVFPYDPRHVDSGQKLDALAGLVRLTCD